jgi:hypothetical protein
MDATTCRLCGADLPDGGGRCPNCGLHRAGDVDRPGLHRVVAELAGIYALTALLVFLTRGR